MTNGAIIALCASIICATLLLFDIVAVVVRCVITYIVAKHGGGDCDDAGAERQESPFSDLDGGGK